MRPGRLAVSRMVAQTALLLCLTPMQGGTQTAASAPKAPAIEARADEVLRKMAKLLAGTKRFTLEAEETFDAEFAHAYRIQLTNVRTLSVERPSRFVTSATGDTLHRASWYDGRSLTVLNKERNVYAIVEMPGSIDAVLDKLAADYQLVLPLSDFLYSDPYQTLMEGVLYGKYLGIHQAGGAACHHLTFGQDGVAWQLWIDAGEQPWPRKLAIAYWEDASVPQYQATFRRWIPDPQLDDAGFRFAPPAGAKQVDPLELVAAGELPRQ
jgi:hypothetical protein